uniref:hypothetical protein n=1 Tax=Sphingobacterium daejeonense TaxID=371142 RepID=UPI0037421B7D
MASIAIIKLPSGETRMILLTCVATIGSVSNAEKANQVLGKAGRKTLVRSSS